MDQDLKLAFYKVVNEFLIVLLMFGWIFSATIRNEAGSNYRGLC